MSRAGYRQVGVPVCGVCGPGDHYDDDCPVRRLAKGEEDWDQHPDWCKCQRVCGGDQ